MIKLMFLIKHSFLQYSSISGCVWVVVGLFVFFWIITCRWEYYFIFFGSTANEWSTTYLSILSDLNEELLETHVWKVINLPLVILSVSVKVDSSSYWNKFKWHHMVVIACVMSFKEFMGPNCSKFGKYSEGILLVICHPSGSLCTVEIICGCVSKISIDL